MSNWNPREKRKERKKHLKRSQLRIFPNNEGYQTTDSRILHRVTYQSNCWKPKRKSWRNPEKKHTFYTKELGKELNGASWTKQREHRPDMHFRNMAMFLLKKWIYRSYSWLFLVHYEVLTIFRLIIKNEQGWK